MKEIATFAAGCFWHVQEIFDNINGVISSRVGYTGGNDECDYDSSEKKGHAEAVEVIFDSEKVSYGDLLKVFWKEHDPTSLDKQGGDVGRRYRSAIFYHSDNQKKAIEKSLAAMQKNIVTEVSKAGKFYEAEEEHQKYNEKHGKVC
jgi:peptide-methionine (S)-S-oxide reductase